MNERDNEIRERKKKKSNIRNIRIGVVSHE